MPSNIDEIFTHLESDAIWDSVKFALEAMVVYSIILLKKASIASSKPKVVGVMIALLSLFISVASAYHSHGRTGFFNGALFAINCFMSASLALVIAYFFIGRRLQNGIKRVAWAKNSQDWITNSTPGDKADITSTSKGLRFGAQFTDVKKNLADNEKPSANMEICFDEPQDFRQWIGISFNIECDTVYPDSEIKIQVVTFEGSGYITGNNCRPVKPNTQTAIFLFREMTWEDWTQKSIFGYLDLKNIVKLAVVVYTSCAAVEYKVSNFALVKSVSD